MCHYTCIDPFYKEQAAIFYLSNVIGGNLKSCEQI